MTQKEELVKKESKIEALESKIDELYLELENTGNIIDELKDTSVLENAHDAIDDLMEEKSKFENQIAGLNKKIADLEEENEGILQNIYTLKKTEQETVDNLNTEVTILKNVIFELEKKNKMLSELGETTKQYEETIANQQDKLEGLYKIMSDLKKENETLREMREATTTDHSTIYSLENNIILYQKKIADLSEENKALREMSETPIVAQSIITNLENNIKQLQKEVADLEEKNEALLETGQTFDQSIITNYEDNITRLQKRIVELEKENKNQIEKNQMLKAALLLHVDIESKHVAPEANVMEDERIISIPKGIVQNRIKARHQVVETREEYGPEEIEIESKEIEEPTIEPEISHPSYYETSEISKVSENLEDSEPVRTEKLLETSLHTSIQEQEEKMELDQEQEVVIIESSTGRRKCPKCGNTNKILIREMPDKTRIISAFAGLYGKKYKCGQCGAEWR